MKLGYNVFFDLEIKAWKWFAWSENDVIFSKNYFPSESKALEGLGAYLAFEFGYTKELPEIAHAQ